MLASSLAGPFQLFSVTCWEWDWEQEANCDLILLTAGSSSAWPDHESKEWYSPQSHETIMKYLYLHVR